MKKTILSLVIVAALSSSCAKKKTCTCTVGSKTIFTETSTDSQKVQSDCNTAQAQANGPTATVPTVCTVQ